MSKDTEDLFDNFEAKNSSSGKGAPSSTRPARIQSPTKTRGQNDEARTVKNAAAASSDGANSRTTSPTAPQTRAKSPQGRPNEKMPGGPVSKDKKAHVAGPKAKEEGAMAALNEDDLDEALSIIRKDANEKSKPLILVLLHMNQFYEEQMHVPSPHCSPLINGILWSMGTGRKINGDDATSHLQHLASKLGEDDSREVLKAARVSLLSQINDPKNAKVIAPFEQIGASETFKNTRKPKAQPVTASDLVDALMSKVTTRGVKRFFLVKHTATEKVLDLVYGQIKRTAKEFEKKVPGLSAECTYLGEHRAEISLTEGNVETLFSAAMKEFGVTAKEGEDGSILTAPGAVGKPFFHYSIKSGNPFYAPLDAYKWTDPTTNEEKRFRRDAAGNIIIPTGARSRAIDVLFPSIKDEKQWTPATPESAVVAIMCKAADDKKEE